MSPNNLLTSCWGPVGWAFLHSVTFGYPEVPTREDADAYRIYFQSLGSVLPCDKCRINYKKNLEIHPIEKYLGSRKDLAYWGYLLHEMVNDELGVKDRLKFEDVWKYYESMRSEGCGGKTCFSPEVKKRCKVQYITDEREEFKNGLFRTKENWPLILAIVVLLIIIIILSLSKIKVRK